jgi:hypothetical protein
METVHGPVVIAAARELPLDIRYISPGVRSA